MKRITLGYIPATAFLRSALVQRLFSACKIVENNECRTSNHRAQHEAKREYLNINGNVSPHSFSTDPLSSLRRQYKYLRRFKEGIDRLLMGYAYEKKPADEVILQAFYNS